MKETKVEIRPDALVLVVDDEQDIRDASERILSRVGYQVQKASRGDEALDILNKKSVDIMLLDLKMPGMDGLDVLERIRKQNTKIQVIVITGYATVETAIEAMKQGAYDFIPKPFEPDQLRIVVNRAIDGVSFHLARGDLSLSVLGAVHGVSSRLTLCLGFTLLLGTAASGRHDAPR